MSEISITVDELNEMRTQCNRRIELADSLRRLQYNDDFKKVFLEEYCRNEPARLVGLLGEQTLMMNDKSAYYKNDINEKMIGIARFSEFMRMVFQIAEQAEKQLEDLQKVQ